jgi:hypothetical protein
MSRKNSGFLKKILRLPGLWLFNPNISGYSPRLLMPSRKTWGYSLEKRVFSHKILGCNRKVSFHSRKVWGYNPNVSLLSRNVWLLYPKFWEKRIIGGYSIFHKGA